MEYGAIALAALGLSVGLLFGVKVLLPIVGLLLVFSLVFSVVSQLTFVDAAMIVLASQSILQGSYFLGVTISVWRSNSRSGRHVL